MAHGCHIIRLIHPYTPPRLNEHLSVSLMCWAVYYWVEIVTIIRRAHGLTRYVLYQPRVDQLSQASGTVVWFG